MVIDEEVGERLVFGQISRVLLWLMLDCILSSVSRLERKMRLNIVEGGRLIIIPMI